MTLKVFIEGVSHAPRLSRIKQKGSGSDIEMSIVCKPGARLLNVVSGVLPFLEAAVC